MRQARHVIVIDRPDPQELLPGIFEAVENDLLHCREHFLDTGVADAFVPDPGGILDGPVRRDPREPVIPSGHAPGLDHAAVDLASDCRGPPGPGRAPPRADTISL